MQDFVILFRQGPRQLTAGELAERRQAVAIWAREQNAAGHCLEPRILAPEALHPMASADSCADPRADPQAATGGWPVTALLFLKAEDIEQAAAVAATHPGGAFGAAIEVRPWAPPPAL
jgi:hypothetical protein